MSTWAHELIHLADDRRGALVRGRGQTLSNEVVAEFGSAILLECMGRHAESDRGGAYTYIQSYCRQHKAEVLTICTDLLDRTLQRGRPPARHGAGSRRRRPLGRLTR